MTSPFSFIFSLFRRKRDKADNSDVIGNQSALVQPAGSWTTLSTSDCGSVEPGPDGRPYESFRSKLRLLTWGKPRPSEYVVNEDTSHGRERHKIMAISYKKNDSAPDDYHYVTRYVYNTPMPINRSLGITSSCDCTGSCNDGKCYCSSTQRTGLYYNSKGQLCQDYNVDAPSVIYECNVACKCNTKLCDNRVIQEGTKHRFSLFRTKSRGWGVRTVDDLPRGSFVGVYSGELISASDSRSRQDDTYLFNLSNSDTIKQNESKDGEESFVCDAKFYGNFTRFINHSCNANVVGVRSYTEHQDQKFPYIAFFTNRDLKSNAELTLNYGDNYWLVKCKRDQVYCLCRQANCKFTKRTFPRTLKIYRSEKRRSS